MLYSGPFVSPILSQRTPMDWTPRDWIEHPLFGVGYVLEDRVDRLDIYFLTAGQRTILKTAELKPAAPPRPDFEFPGHRRTSSASQLNAKGSPRRSRAAHAAARFPQTE